MEKRAIVVILVIIFLIVIFGGIAYYIYNNYQENEPLPEIKDLEFFIKPIDQETKKDISIDFMLFEGQVVKDCLNDESFELYQENKTKFFDDFSFLKEKIIDQNGCYVTKILPSFNKKGNMVPGLNKFEINPNKLYLFYIYGKDHYVDRKIFLPSSVSRNDAKEFILSNRDEVYLIKEIKDKSIKEIIAYPFENDLGIDLHGEIKGNKQNNVRLVLNGSKNLRDLVVCFEWSFGITHIIFNLEEFKVPYSFKQIDKCYSLERSIDKENHYLQFDFNLTTKQFLEGWEEYLNVFIIDQDYFFDGSSWQKGIIDQNNQDIGAIHQSENFIVYK